MVLLFVYCATAANFLSLGLGAALSPAELRAAEAAEKLLEQEKRDALLAQRLQVPEAC